MNRQSEFDVEIPTAEILAQLEINYENHKKMYQESIDGFLKFAENELARRLDMVKSKHCKKLSVTLSPPENHEADYRTAIGMVKMHKGDTIVLGAYEFRTLMEDEWDWVGMWLLSNRAYSPSVTEYSNEKRHLLRE